MAYDIITTVMDQLVTLYTTEMQTDVSDALKLTLIEKAPLQDDVTLVAPFVIVAFDFDKGRMLDTYHEPEISGGLNWINHFIVVGRIPIYDSKTAAYAAIGELNEKALRVLIHHYNLDGVVADNGESVCYSGLNLIDVNRIRTFGGENEWYGEFSIEFHYYSQESSTQTYG